MSGLEISKTIFPFSKGHQIAIENNSFNQAYISIAYGDLCMVETVRWWSRGGGGGGRSPPKKIWIFVTSHLSSLLATELSPPPPQKKKNRVGEILLKDRILT